MTKFIHVADLHLGYRQYGFAQREQDFYAALDEVGRLALEQNCPVIIAGDIFDMPKPPAMAVLKLQGFVDRLKGQSLNVFAIEGNHDLTGENLWLKVCGIIPLGEHAAYVDGARVIGFNYGKPEVILKAIQDLADSGEKADVLVTHTGYVEMQGDFASQFSARELAPVLKKMGVRYVANGHIHMWSKVDYDGVTFCQPGSLELKAINEPPFKSVALVTIDEHSVSVMPVEYPTRKVFIKQIDTEEVLQQVLESLPSHARHLVLLYVNKQLDNVVDRITKVANDYPEMMYRITTIGEQAATFDRAKGVATLAEAIGQYFAEDSDEYSLVVQCLQNPDNAGKIAKEYIDGDA